MKSRFLTLLFLFPLVTVGCQNENTATAADDEEIIAIVNGVSIPASRMALYAQGRQVTDENRQEVIENMITSELILQAAAASGIADRPEVRQELVVAEQTVIGRAYVTDFFARNPVNETQLQVRYDEMLQQFAGQQEYNVAHILVETEEAAQDILAELQEDPSTFAELAAEHSTDPGSAANGGSLGWVQAQSLVPSFSAAMQALAVGETSTAPVESDYGWHIIRVDETREVEPPALDDALRERLQQAAIAEKLTQHFDELRAQAEIEIK